MSDIMQNPETITTTEGTDIPTPEPLYAYDCEHDARVVLWRDYEALERALHAERLKVQSLENEKAELMKSVDHNWTTHQQMIESRNMLEAEREINKVMEDALKNSESVTRWLLSIHEHIPGSADGTPAWAILDKTHEKQLVALAEVERIRKG